MPAKRYRVSLSVEEQQKLKGLVSRGRAAAYKQTHARILLLSDENQECGAMKDEEIARALRVGDATVGRVRRRCVEEGVEAALGRRQQANHRPRKLDGQGEAHLTHLACSEPPEGRAGWTLQLLADRLVQGSDSGEQSYARVRAGQRRLTGESTQECILHGEACRLDRDRVCTGGYYPMDSMVREPCDGIIGDAPAGAIPFHRLFDVVGSLRRRALEGNPGGGDEQRQERCRTGGTVPAEPQRGRH